MNAGRREEIRALIAKAKAYEDHPLTDLEWGLIGALEECFEELDKPETTGPRGCIDCGFERCCLACRMDDQT